MYFNKPENQFFYIYNACRVQNYHSENFLPLCEIIRERFVNLIFYIKVTQFCPIWIKLRRKSLTIE